MGSGERSQATGALQSQSNLAQSQADLSRQLANQSGPWTTLAGNYYGNILKGGDALTKAVAPQINAVTGQYGVARQRAQETPLGGERDRALRTLNMGEAGQKSSIYSGGVQDALSKLGAMGQGGTSQALGGYGSAASNFASIASQFGNLAAQKGGTAGALGGALGGVTSAALGAIPGGAAVAPLAGIFSGGGATGGW
jgi:hypothetical protein